MHELEKVPLWKLYRELNIDWDPEIINLIESYQGLNEDELKMKPDALEPRSDISESGFK